MYVVADKRSSQQRSRFCSGMFLLLLSGISAEKVRVGERRSGFPNTGRYAPWTRTWPPGNGMSAIKHVKHDLASTVDQAEGTPD